MISLYERILPSGLNLQPPDRKSVMSVYYSKDPIYRGPRGPKSAIAI